MRTRYRIQFPAEETNGLGQDEAYFYLTHSGERQTIRFHDYAAIYRHAGLYEQLFYDRLKCQSPNKVADILRAAVGQTKQHFAGLRVLDLGAGNGMMGDLLKGYGVSRLVGVDILPEAQEATDRDRPGVYDEYYVADLCLMDDDTRKDLSSWSFNCLTTVAALGFGDIPPQAFVEAFNTIQSEGWVALNIKETFLTGEDTSGFSTLLRGLIFSDFLDVHHLERYRHRYSIEGEPLYYFAIAGRKNRDITAEFLAQTFSGQATQTNPGSCCGRTPVAGGRHHPR